MKKFLSIMMITLMIIVTIVGVTACTKDEPDKESEKNKLIGTWFGKEQVEDGKIGMYYYTVITQDETHKNVLTYKQYGIAPSRETDDGRELGSYYDFPKSTMSAVSGQLRCKFRANNVDADLYKVVLVNDDKYTVACWDGKEEGTPYSGYDERTYVFERTTMTLEQFRETYGQYTVEK